MVKLNRIFEEIAFDKLQIEQSLLNIENKERSNIFTWNGQFSPQFVEVILDKYAKNGDVILDPFLGSGTVIYESGLKKLTAYGIELNISAYFISRLYTYINVKIEDRIRILSSIENILNNTFALDESNVDIIAEKLKDINDKITNENEKIVITGFIVILDLYNKKLDTNILFAKWRQLRDSLENLPFSEQPINVINNDSRNIPMYDNIVDLVITSPPYINVYNYHQQYRKSIELLGYNVLEIAKSEVGSNRKHRSNRFFTVVQYTKDICLILKELIRVTKKNARIIFVVGRESNVRGVSFLNSRIVYRLATEVLELEFDLKQERVFKNRYGQMIYEDILHIINNKESNIDDINVLITKAGEIAVEELIKSKANVCDEIILEEIQSAIENVNNINISPIAPL